MDSGKRNCCCSNCFSRNKKVIVTEILYCGLCFEEGKIRKCCKGIFCDHCYTKNKMCPSCKNATRQEKTTGATFMIQPVSELEECRICLDPGLKRRCCGNYYCDDCYYSLSNCRSCGKAVTARGLNMDFKDKATLFSVFLGWAVTIFLLIALVGVGGIVASNQILTPVGLSGYYCYGFYKTCDTTVCISVSNDTFFEADTSRSPISVLKPLYDWEYCTLNDTIKLRAQACIFDSSLYSQTNGALGYDVCASQFEKGVYIFEDDFDNWRNSTHFTTNEMKSAKWNNIVNAEVDNGCGTASGSSGALHFSGDFYRFVNTLDLDVRHGGWLEADLFISPISFDFSHPKCKAAYQGGVSVQYSIDKGMTWTDLEYYDAAQFRSSDFFHIQLALPAVASTNSTRFQFQQLTFEDARDGWAIDNVRVFHYFDSHWQSKKSYQEGIISTQERMQLAECCFDTERCQTKLTAEQLNDCYSLPNFQKNNYILRGSDLTICIVAFIGICKFIYVSVQNWLMCKRYPFNDEIEGLLKFDFILKLIPVRWRPKRKLKDLVANVHQSARLVKHLRDALGDDPVQEDPADAQKRREAERLAIEKEQALAKKLERKKKRKIRSMKKKLKENNYLPMISSSLTMSKSLAPGASNVYDLEGSDEERKEVGEGRNSALVYPMAVATVTAIPVYDPNSGLPSKVPGTGTGTGTGKPNYESEVDDIKKKNLSLRIPFDIKVSYIWRLSFFLITVGLFAIVFLYRASTQSYYKVTQSIDVYGIFTSQVEFSSNSLLFLALACDFKELYYNLKHVVPLRDDWIPMVTADISEEINSLFVGNFIIKLQDIKQSAVFSSLFITGCAIAFGLGSLPICMLSLVLRDMYLSFGIMRIVTPTVGFLLAYRALLGGGVVLKTVFALNYVLDFRTLARQRIGSAFQHRRVGLAAINTALSLSLVGGFITAAVSIQYAAYALGGLFAIGLMYGGFTGCIHSLPIRPWMTITTLREGVWLRVKKQQSCPCVYRGKYCTDLHTFEEIFVVFPRDLVSFMSVLKGVNEETV